MNWKPVLKTSFRKGFAGLTCSARYWENYIGVDMPNLNSFGPEGFTVNPGDPRSSFGLIVFPPDDLLDVRISGAVKFHSQIMVDDAVETFLAYTRRFELDADEAGRGWVCQKKEWIANSSPRRAVYSNVGRLNLGKSYCDTDPLPVNEWIRMWLQYHAGPTPGTSAAVWGWTRPDEPMPEFYDPRLCLPVRDGLYDVTAGIGAVLAGGQPNDASAARTFGDILIEAGTL